MLRVAFLIESADAAAGGTSTAFLSILDALATRSDRVTTTSYLLRPPAQDGDRGSPKQQQLGTTWWDTVDALASRVAVLLAAYPAPLAKTLRAWAKQDNMWLRRVAIIAQVGARETTDRTLLYDCIGPSIDSKEFFLRKAIGWALREYAKADPGEVRRYLRAHRANLSPLSVREAEKGLDRAKRHGILKKSTRRKR